MNWKRMTVVFIIIMFAAVAGYDALTISQGGVATSISQTMIDWSYKYPIFTFIMGIICGHLFWKISDSKKQIEK